jgi:hypothetical protein
MRPVCATKALTLKQLKVLRVEYFDLLGYVFV